MAKLNQIIAVEKGVKSQTYSKIGELHKVNQKPDLFNGFAKSYLALADDGEKLEPQGKRVQYTTKENLRSFERLTSEALNTTARKDWTNTQATADLVVDGKVILQQVPVTYLLYLEKQALDIRAFFEALPVLDAAFDWTFDKNAGLYKTDDIKTHRTTKVEEPLVLIAPTDKHPGQAKTIIKDVISGYWTETKMSGAIDKPTKDSMLERADKLLAAIKTAREAANGRDEVDSPSVGDAVFGFLLSESA